MKNALFSILSYLCISTFLLYWISMVILAMPTNYGKETIKQYAPRFKTMFGNSWKLFTAPYTYNYRMYIIVKNHQSPGKIDTIEVLEKIAIQKQQHAPFNQKENIIDNLVNNNVGGMIKTIWFNKIMPTEGVPYTTDSFYIANAIAHVANNENYINYLLH